MVKTLLVALAHPDDEVGCAGTIAAHRAAGDRVVLLWLTRGEMTEVFGSLEEDEVARRRVAQGHQAAALLDAEAEFLDFPDTAVHATPEAAARLARVIARIQPDAVVTWGDAWVRGMRHPDHQATGKIVRDAITLARLRRVVEPAPPHRDPAPVFTIRADRSHLPEAAIDVSSHLDTILDVARHHRDTVGWPDPDWLLDRLRQAGEAYGVRAAERFDAWETEPGLTRRLV